MTGTPPRSRPVLVDAIAALVSVVVVVAAAATMLYAVDGLPAWLTGEPRYVRRARSVEEVERRLRARLVLPYYFPSTLSWPPSHIRFTIGPPGAAAMSIDDRQGKPCLFLAETVAAGAIPERIVPSVQILSSSPIAVGTARGVLSRVVEGGTTQWELRWEQGGRGLLMRSRGSVDELIRIARSVREAQ